MLKFSICVVIVLVVRDACCCIQLKCCKIVSVSNNILVFCRSDTENFVLALHKISPLSGFRMPAMSLSSVVFPQPFDPMQTAALGMICEQFWRIGFRPYRNESFRSSIILFGFRRDNRAWFI